MNIIYIYMFSYIVIHRYVMMRMMNFCSSYLLLLLWRSVNIDVHFVPCHLRLDFMSLFDGIIRDHCRCSGDSIHLGMNQGCE